MSSSRSRRNICRSSPLQAVHWPEPRLTFACPTRPNAGTWPQMPTPGNKGQGEPGGPSWPRGAPGLAHTPTCAGCRAWYHMAWALPPSRGTLSPVLWFLFKSQALPKNSTFPTASHAASVPSPGARCNRPGQSVLGGPGRSTHLVSPPARPGHAAELLPRRLPARGPLALAVPSPGDSVFTSPSPTLRKPFAAAHTDELGRQAPAATPVCVRGP